MEFDAARLLSEYGYLAVFLGSILEGETILILAGFAAHQGYLSFPAVAGVAFCGGALGDLVCFFLGRRYGKAVFDRFPKLTPHVATVDRLILKYHSAVIVMVRFMYGLRVAGPVIIGASGVAPLRFAAFNVLGAAIWAVLVGGAGYVFGHALEWIFQDLKRYEHWAMGAVAVIGAALALRHWMQARKKRWTQAGQGVR